MDLWISKGADPEDAYPDGGRSWEFHNGYVVTVTPHEDEYGMLWNVEITHASAASGPFVGDTVANLSAKEVETTLGQISRFKAIGASE